MGGGVGGGGGWEAPTIAPLEPLRTLHRWLPAGRAPTGLQPV